MKTTKLTLISITILATLLLGAIGINMSSAATTSLKGEWYNHYYTTGTTPPDPWKLKINLYSYYYPGRHWIYLDTSTILLEGLYSPESTPYKVNWGKDLIVPFHGPDVLDALLTKAGHMSPGIYTIYLTVTAKDLYSSTIYSGSFHIHLTIRPVLPLISQGKTAVASSSQSSYPPSNAFDGSLSTRWVSSSSGSTQWIYVDLGDTADIGEVKLYWGSVYALSYKIQVSDDHSTWCTIYSTSYGDGGTDDLFISGTGQYVRMYATRRSSWWGSGYSLNEFEVYGTFPPPPPP